MDVLLSLLSEDAVFRIALRRAIWTDRKDNAAGKTRAEAFPHLFDDLSSYGWEERDMEFDTKHPESI